MHNVICIGFAFLFNELANYMSNMGYMNYMN